VHHAEEQSESLKVDAQGHAKEAEARQISFAEYSTAPAFLCTQAKNI
jgi:hypothetical protein